MTTVRDITMGRTDLSREDERAGGMLGARDPGAISDRGWFQGDYSGYDFQRIEALVGDPFDPDWPDTFRLTPVGSPAPTSAVPGGTPSSPVPPGAAHHPS